ncbi:high frequency lysogenization protein HflD [Candidatus Steffania adelgidicola]|uniref:high frequency lysogenization protein HflD n=1 Tax=Candidatus Steffania adelgidicola TaxID=1076626 RepID=UPI001D02E24B|nr:high frequency lysogenization protein HflD [Candidatus Steffania adelgidicola]UDG79675.1 High frequency lysogenization protein HflD [Candidatus Steffania adelgidicola]
MAKNYFDITLALAGIFQSARLVQQLAHQSQCDTKPLRVSLQSLLDLNPPSVCAVYGDNPSHLQMGLETLQCVLNGSSRQGLGVELTRYTLGLMLLEPKLNRNRSAQKELSYRINGLERQLSHFDLLSDTLISAIASIYVDIISPLGPRIQVTGASSVLQNTQIQIKVRAVLLAGIRSTVLWKQVGGRRLQLMFHRKQLFKEAKQILTNS